MFGLFVPLALFGAGGSYAQSAFKNTPLYRHLVRGPNPGPARLYENTPVDSGKEAEAATEATGQKQQAKPDDKPAEQARASDGGRRSRRVPAPGRAPEALTDPSTFTPDMPLREAVDILRNSTWPRLNIVVLWKDLEENADIYPDTPIGIDGVSGVPLSRHLKSLVDGVSGGSPEKLGYVVEDGVIVIATLGTLPARMVTRVYDITDLVGQPANYGLMGFGLGFGGTGMMGGFGAVPYGGGYGLQGGLTGGLTGGFVPQYGNFGVGTGLSLGYGGGSYGPFR